ncbi:hypothetical protein E3N88_04653 [Mikania micrantha]|uniref:Integrase catalytic domain-containing protein n=1 Tax=Mikania micrantha TaxID=192012 RepID=A0A5N6PV28_9ASTR|nr:hypothetical protein E3N88_04653 [Mikania micrantha]
MVLLAAFDQKEKAIHNSHKFGFTLSPSNYGYWKTMIHPFLVTNGLWGYVDGTIQCPPTTVQSITTPGKDNETAVISQPNPNHSIWISNDAHVRMLILSTVSETSFQHVQGTTSRDLWLSLERAYAPHTSSREFTLKTQLLKIAMKSDESSSAYLARAWEYADALANIGEPMKEKDIVFLVISGLREEYNGLKSTLLTRQFPTAFSELHGLLSDHEYLITKPSDVTPAQAFTAVSNGRITTTPYTGSSLSQSDTLQAIQQLASQLGLQLKPPSSQPSQAYYTNRSRNSNNRANNNQSGNNRGRGTHNSRNTGGVNRNQFSWASAQNTVYGTCHRCGIGHIPSQCPNCDPATLRGRQQQSNNYSANYADSRFPTASSWLPDTGSNQHDKSTRTILLMGPSNGGLYSFHLPRLSTVSKVAFSTNRVSSNTWHQRLGHPHPQLLKAMLFKYQLPLSNKCTPFCEPCSIGKSSKLHLVSSTYKSSHILDLVFCDVWGPAPVASFDNHRYFLLCVDHFSRFSWIFPLKLKSDVYDIFRQFVVMVERQFNTKLKSVQSDWGGEFRNLTPFFKSLGIIHQLTCPHTSEQNGFVERRHRHVVETGLTLLAQSNVPTRFWHFAFDTAVFLINRMPSRTNSNISPFEKLFKRCPDFSFLRVFGCRCYPHIRSYNKHKMDFRSLPCVFLGYSTSHHGYRCFDPISDHLFIARHVRFDEQCFPFSLNTPQPTTPPIHNPYISTYPSTIFPSDDSSSQPISPTPSTHNLQPITTHSAQPITTPVSSPPLAAYQPLSTSDSGPTHKTEDDKTVEAFVTQYGALNMNRYKYNDIKKMTNSFQVKLGQGGFGQVFKGKLSDGRLVAVKLLNSSKANGQEFINEVASIGRTSHVNIVTLLGFCFDYKKRALVYEYMPNGSLEKFIYSHVHMGTSEYIGATKLYEIALGIAYGLDYLHRGCNTRILHLDIKPHNILLDEDFCPKIADFGLAKLYSRKESIVSMLEARGTIGYIAPEVYNKNFGGVSHKSDVYSYGMLLLEMVCERKNIDADVGSGRTSEIYFPDWIYKRLQKDGFLLDSIITKKEDDYARKMTIVGLWCIQPAPNHRPAINEVIEMLEGSIQALEMPPKPFFSSPPRSPEIVCSSSESMI